MLFWVENTHAVSFLHKLLLHVVTKFVIHFHIFWVICGRGNKCLLYFLHFLHACSLRVIELFCFLELTFFCFTLYEFRKCLLVLVNFFGISSNFCSDFYWFFSFEIGSRCFKTLSHYNPTPSGLGSWLDLLPTNLWNHSIFANNWFRVKWLFTLTR